MTTWEKKKFWDFFGAQRTTNGFRARQCETPQRNLTTLTRRDRLAVAWSSDLRHCDWTRDPKRRKDDERSSVSSLVTLFNSIGWAENCHFPPRPSHLLIMHIMQTEEKKRRQIAIEKSSPTNSATALKGQIWLVELLFRKEGLILRAGNGKNKNKNKSRAFYFFLFIFFFLRDNRPNNSQDKTSVTDTKTCRMHEKIKKIRTELSRIPCSLSLAMFATRCFALRAVWFFSPLLRAARQASSQVGGSAPELWSAWSPSQVWKVNLRYSVSSTASTVGYNSFPVDMKPWNRIFDPLRVMTAPLKTDCSVCCSYRSNSNWTRASV